MSLRSLYLSDAAAGRDVSGHDGRPSTCGVTTKIPYGAGPEPVQVWCDRPVNHREREHSAPLGDYARVEWIRELDEPAGLTSVRVGPILPGANRSASPANPERPGAEPVTNALPPRVHELESTEAFSWPPLRLRHLLATPDRAFVFSHVHLCAGSCGRALVCNGPAVCASAAVPGETYYHCRISREWMCEACELEAKDAHMRGVADDEETARRGRERAEAERRARECKGPYAVRCPEHGLVYLTLEEYDAQMMAAGDLWKCPIDHGDAIWDDDNYESYRQE